MVFIIYIARNNFPPLVVRCVPITRSHICVCTIIYIYTYNIHYHHHSIYDNFSLFYYFIQNEPCKMMSDISSFMLFEYAPHTHSHIYMNNTRGYAHTRGTMRSEGIPICTHEAHTHTHIQSAECHITRTPPHTKQDKITFYLILMVFRYMQTANYTGRVFSYKSAHLVLEVYNNIKKNIRNLLLKRIVRTYICVECVRVAFTRESDSHRRARVAAAQILISVSFFF